MISFLECFWAQEQYLGNTRHSITSWWMSSASVCLGSRLQDTAAASAVDWFEEVQHSSPKPVHWLTIMKQKRLLYSAGSSRGAETRAWVFIPKGIYYIGFHYSLGNPKMPVWIHGKTENLVVAQSLRLDLAVTTQCWKYGRCLVNSLLFSSQWKAWEGCNSAVEQMCLLARHKCEQAKSSSFPLGIS